VRWPTTHPKLRFFSRTHVRARFSLIPQASSVTVVAQGFSSAVRQLIVDSRVKPNQPSIGSIHQQRFWLFQIGRSRTFTESVVGIGEHRVRLVGRALLPEQSAPLATRDRCRSGTRWDGKRCGQVVPRAGLEPACGRVQPREPPVVVGLGSVPGARCSPFRNTEQAFLRWARLFRTSIRQILG
jgi:hypothetical protein